VFGFRDGKAIAQFLGAQPEAQVRAFIEGLLPSPHEATLDEVARLIEAGDAEAAERLLDQVPYNIDWEARAEALRAAIGFLRAGGADEGALRARVAAAPDDHAARLQLARLLAGRRRWQEAMDQLLEIVKKDKDWSSGEARTQLLHMFRLAEGEPGLVTEYRRKLATLLY
jgi:putative thioredoxin